jgi:hypothetical protein
MKTNRFLSLAAIFGLAIALTFFACSSDSPSESPPAGEPSSDSSGNAVKLCGNVEYDDSIYRCESGELIGKCRGADFYPAYQVCNDGVIEDKGTDVSSSSNPDISSSGGSSPSTVIPDAFQFLGSGYNVISSAYINPSDAIKHRNYPVLNREKMFQDGLFASTKQPQESFSTVAGSSIKETINQRNLKIGVEADLPSLPFFGGFSGSGDYENIKNSKMLESMSFAKLNYYNYKEDLSIKDATKEKLKDYLTDDFKNDLKTKNAAQIIELYGTHVFVQYYNGGSLEANYTYAYAGKEDVETVRMAAAAKFKTVPGVTVSGDFSNSTNTSNLDKEENLAFKYQSFGGNTIGAGDLTALRNKFQGWATSIKESNAVICGIAGFKSSLIPIWDLASAGGFSTEANALKTEYNSRAGSIKFPAARFYKVDKKPAYTKVGLTPVTLKYSGGTIAEIEIYALGAGGGGQGGDNTYKLGAKDIGTGGAGGGGAATYVKLGNFGLDKNDSVSLNITIGKGGTGGDYIYENISGDHSGYNGKKGDDTKVVYKTGTVTAYGGSGGGGNSPQTNGGSGGQQSALPSDNFYIDGYSAPGNPGGKGNWQKDTISRGGDAAKITGKGTLASFGGGKGAVRSQGGNSVTEPEDGGGGRGGYSYNNGTDGKNGKVEIVVKYYWEEGGFEANPYNFGTACNSYCRWDTGCFEIRTDPDGIYGDANSTCSAANTNCDYYGQGRYSNATCSGTPISSAKPQSCGSYCRWDTGCYENKTDPAGLYGTVSTTSCTTVISTCDEWGERYSNGDCL